MKKITYYFLSCVWGFPLTLFGFLTAGVLLACGFKPKKHAGCWYFEVGKGWGGFEGGLVFVCSVDSGKYLKDHEFGHNIQNCVYGPITPFLITIPSALRYWWRRISIKRGVMPAVDYYSAWFEQQASVWGKEFADKWDEDLHGGESMKV